MKKTAALRERERNRETGAARKRAALRGREQRCEEENGAARKRAALKRKCRRGGKFEEEQRAALWDGAGAGPGPA